MKREVAYTRYVISKKDKKNLASKVSNRLSKELGNIVLSTNTIELLKYKLVASEVKIYLFNKLPSLIEKEELIFPSIILFFKYPEIRFSSVIVDEGAIPHILNGADIMAPGVIKVIGELKENVIVSIKDEKKRRVFAIGLVLDNPNEKMQKRKGRLLKNLHYVGDKIWNLYKNLVK